MSSRIIAIPILFLLFCSRVESASLFERSYEYVVNLGKNIAPTLMSILDCMGEPEVWSCTKEKAGKILDGWNEEVEKERRSWKVAADAEVGSTGRSLEEMPSKLGGDVEKTLGSLAEIVNHAMARALSGKKHESGGIDSITISTGGGEKKKIKKTKPPKIHLIHPMMVPMRKTHKQEKGRSFPNGRQSWVIGDKVMTAQEVTDVEKALTKQEHESTVAIRKGRDANVDVLPDSEVDVRGADREGRDVMSDLWSMGEEALDAVAEHALDAEDKDNGIKVKSSFTEQRGKKKKKKKAILKLLILGAVLKAKIGTLLQILSFKLQVKFFIVAVLGLAINLARLWIDIKNKHKDQPQKVIYYEHAQHQHHYDHEDEHESAGGWGPWSRSMLPEEQTDVDVDVDFQNSPYRVQQRNSPYFRPQQINA